MIRMACDFALRPNARSSSLSPSQTGSVTTTTATQQTRQQLDVPGDPGLNGLRVFPDPEGALCPEWHLSCVYIALLHIYGDEGLYTLPQHRLKYTADEVIALLAMYHLHSTRLKDAHRGRHECLSTRPPRKSGPLVHHEDKFGPCLSAACAATGSFLTIRLALTSKTAGA